MTALLLELTQGSKITRRAIRAISRHELWEVQLHASISLLISPRQIVVYKDLLAVTTPSGMARLT